VIAIIISIKFRLKCWRGEFDEKIDSADKPHRK
jgi:hypothetical protein